jgi:hypothetical protein
MLALLESACTTVLYKGPSRPASEISVLTSQSARIVKVDDVRVSDSLSGNSARYEVLPGDHEVAFSLNRTIPGFMVTRVQYSRPIIVCVQLEPGHTYRFEPVIKGQRWLPQVVDLNDHTLIDPSCEDENAPPRAAALRSAPRAPAVVAAASPTSSAPLASAETAPPAPDGSAPAPDGGAAPADADQQPDGQEAPPVGAPAPAPRVAGAVDRERPRGTRPRSSRAPEDGASEAEASERRPGTGLSLFTGFGFGGTDFVKASSSNGDEQTLSAGQGFILGMGGMVTPLWLGEHAGFGAGLDVAWKYDNIDASNGSASISRFPIALTAHFLTNGDGGNHYLMLKGGVIRDFGVNYSASGFGQVDTSVRGTWGPLGELGY